MANSSTNTSSANIELKNVALRALKIYNKFLGMEVGDDFDHFEFNVVMVSTPVIANARQLSVRWTAEEDQNLQVEVDPSAEDNLRRVLEAMRHDP